MLLRTGFGGRSLITHVQCHVAKGFCLAYNDDKCITEEYCKVKVTALSIAHDDPVQVTFSNLQVRRHQ